MSESKSKSKLDEALTRLAELVDAAAASEEMRRYLKAVALFHEYSWFNALLIACQYPNATRVAGYKTWQKLGRQVRKGERGIVIAAPVFSKTTIVKENEMGEKDEMEIERLVGFRDAYVFDISQTEGEDLSEPQWWANRPADERLLALKARMLDAIQKDGIKVVALDDMGGARGVSIGGVIGVLDGDNSVGALSTLIHEWTHELQRRETVRPERNVREVEAEATAYVVLAHYGVELPENGNYIALWQDDQPISKFFKSISKYARYILEKIEASD
ncbi:MAG: ArdC family protein [Chloroflexota bacterium]|jgi:hypothetical protein